MISLKQLLTVGALTMAINAGAQITEDPTAWQYEVRKKNANTYELIFHMNIKSGWHIWSLNPGGDGYEIAPSFTFDKNARVKLKGKVKEKGIPTVTKIEGIDGKVTYYSGKVDYVQEVTVAGATRITGKHGYQVCNDRMCLPPTDKTFAFEVK